MTASDDGRIFVCVRVRDPPAGPQLVAAPQTPHPADYGATPGTPRLMRKNSAAIATPGVNNANSAAAPPPVDPSLVCVSTLENVVVMHDPRAVEDSASVAKDAGTLIQALQAREGGCLDPLPTSRHANPMATTLIGSATANYYECDECIVSMSADNVRQMPMIRDSDFLQPPAYGRQEDVYQSTAAKAVAASLEGINSCVFAYGQTGSGKTYTLFGDTSSLSRDPGIVCRTLDDLFRKLDDRKQRADLDPAVEYTFRVTLSFFEIYQSDVTCLLSKRGPLKVLVTDAAPVIQELESRVINNLQQAIGLVEMGLRRRQTGETGMNAKSSRSHAIVQITLQQWSTRKSTKETIEFTSVVNLVDLAGSERQRTAKTEGKSHKEGIQINQSLATLARVINEISRGAKFVNYRDSMLTLILKENLGGNSKTFMIATINPTVHAYHESCATLQYAKDVRKIRNKPKVNRTFQTRGHLQEINTKLKEENEQLRSQLEALLRAHGVEPAQQTDNCFSRTQSLHPHFARLDTMTRIAAGEEVREKTPEDLSRPIVISMKRVISSDALVPTVRVDGQINITSLDQDTMELDLRPFFAGVEESDPCGVLLFECITQRGCEKSFWLRWERPGTESSFFLLDVNSKRIMPDTPTTLQHGDVIVVSRDDPNRNEQEMFVLHFVDLSVMSNNNAAMPRDGASLPREHDSRAALLRASPTGGDRVVQLEREVAKLLDIISQQAKTIDYQCQKENARLLNATNNVQVSASSSEARGSSVTSVQTVASPHHPHRSGAVRDGSLSPTVLLEEFDNAAKKDGVLTTSISPPTAMNSRQGSHQLATTLNMSRAGSLLRSDNELSARCEAAIEENKALQVKLAECQEMLSTLELEKESLSYRLEQLGELHNAQGNPVTHNTHSSASSSTMNTPRGSTASSTQYGVSPMKRRGTGDGELSAAELRERLLAAKREKSLKDEIAKLEAIAEELNHQIRSLERMMEDAEAEHMIVLHECQSEAAEVSRALLSTTADYDNVCCQLQSLQELARRSEEALTEAHIVAEAEFEKKLSTIAAERRAYCSLARAWKWKAVDAMIKAALIAHASGPSVALRSSCRMSCSLESKRTAESVKDRLLAPYQHLSHDMSTTLDADAIAAALQQMETETSTSVVDVLKANVDDLERENTQLQERLESMATTLEEQTTKIAILSEEHRKLEQEKCSADDKLKAKALLALKKKNEELQAAERVREELSAKLEAAMQGKMKLQHRVAGVNQMLLDEQKRNGVKMQEELRRLRSALAQKDEEINLLKSLPFSNAMVASSSGTAAVGAVTGDGLSTAKAKLEEVIADATAAIGASAIPASRPNSLFARTASAFSNVGTTNGGDQYNAFPKQFVFSDTMITMSRVCLRMLMDRLKVELYVLNKATVQAISNLLPTVQYRADAVFQGCMADIRRVITSTSKSAQRIGAKWSVQSDPASIEQMLRTLTDADRRTVHKSLIGFLLWYDHWDLVSKKDNASYIELIRNSEILQALARFARAETVTPSNSLCCGFVDDVIAASDPQQAPPAAPGDAPGCVEGRKIVSSLLKSQSSSVLAQQLRSPLRQEQAVLKQEAVATVQIAAPQTLSHSPEATPPPSHRVVVHSNAAKGPVITEALVDVCRRLNVASQSPPRGGELTARHHVAVPDSSAVVIEAVATLDADMATCQGPVMPLTATDVDMALQFTRENTASVFSVPPKVLFEHGSTASLQHVQRTVVVQHHDPTPAIAIPMEPSSSAIPSSVAKRLTHMSEDEVVRMVMKEKKKIFHNANAVKDKAGGGQQALLSFFRTMSPPNSRLTNTVITSPQVPLEKKQAPAVVPVAPVQRPSKTAAAGILPPKLNLTRISR